MKRFILIFLLGAVVLSWACTQEGSTAEKDKGKVAWLTDFEEAKDLAGRKNLPILVNFSGSDWCGWCMKLSNEVFTQSAFLKYADENLVLFLADFPRQKKQDEAIRSQNEKLARRFGLRGFPTVLILDARGNELARTGYQYGGAEKYVEHLKGLIASGK
jgi:protein disulfide-isomerase